MNSRDRGVFFPLSVGYNVVRSNNLNAGVKARTNFRYLTSISAEGTSTFGPYSNTISGSDLDTIDATRFFVSPGLGLYAGYDIGRFTPSLEAGALYDLQGSTTTQSDKNKFLNLYAALALRFRFFDDGVGD